MPTNNGFCVIDKNSRKQGYLLFCVGHRKRVVRESTAEHPFTVVDMEGSDLKKVKILLNTVTKDDKNTDGKYRHDEFSINSFFFLNKVQDNFFEVLLFNLETWTKLNSLGKIQT